MKFLFIFLFPFQLFSQCVVPAIILETVKITENETLYPFWIRTNDTKRLDEFNETIKYFKYKKTEDNKLIDCINVDNCTKIVTTLVSKNIKNLDLGLFQINYKDYPYSSMNKYFDEILSYEIACDVIQEKIKIAKSWSWTTLASYYSSTPHLNEKYKTKLINNYLKLTKNSK